MAFSFIVSTTFGAAFGVAASHSNPIDTTGADFLVAAIGAEGTVGTVTITDTLSGVPTANTWTPLTYYRDSGTTKWTQLYYCFPSSVGADHVFFIATGNVNYPVIAVEAFSGGTTASVDQETGLAQASGTSTIQPGSLTPSVNDCLLVTCLNTAGTPSVTVDSSFTKTTSINEGASNDAIYMGYLIETTATAKNPTWTASGGSAIATAFAVFSPTAITAGNPWLTYAQMRRQ